MKLAAFIVNAFMANGSGGNPAGVVLNADRLRDAERLAIAAEIGVPETAFVCDSGKATYKVRFFTPTEEVDLCGHATIASWALLRRNGLCASGTFTQETLAGILEVSVGDDELVYMRQPQPQFFQEVTIAEIAPALGLLASDFHATLPSQLVSTGLKDMMVPVRNKAILNSIQPDMATIRKISRKYGITGLHVFALLNNEASNVAARNFSPLVGIPEEAATGTANGAALCYLRERDALPAQSEYRIEQGETMGRLSYIYGRFQDSDIYIGGRAKIVRRLKLRR